MDPIPFVNNVTRLLDSRKIPYTVHRYDYPGGVHSAVQVADAIGLPPEQVFKTLVALPGDPGLKPVVAVIPGPATLDLKALARLTGVKKVRMATHSQAEELTGMQPGGISPLALINGGFRFFLDRSARRFSTIAVSAGERGVNLELAADALEGLVRARVADLCE